MKKLTHKYATALMLLGAVAGIGLTAGTTTAHASNKYLSGIGGNEYVRTKRAMYVGIYQKHGNTYKPLLKKKGALLKINGMTQKFGSPVIKVGFTSGAVHYNRLSKLRFTSTPTIPLTKANFKKVSLKAPLRTTVLRGGKGFKQDSKLNYGNGSAFYLTLDNYIQYYSKPAMLKYDGGGTMVVDNGHNDSYSNFKPTVSAKMTKTTVKGNTTTVQYNKYIKGIPGKKLTAHKYQIKIKNLKTHGGKYFSEEDRGSWDNYTVNNKPYFSGMMYTD
ncbi:hypothetical protein [Levilactobacillus brevis]|uniref:hypothetical protein n=1 Tax=Levilactobacillus brevis TaxID=1580 RepID=UPI000BE7C492|nr:hypothetical protein [Levilactobacillus brevis]MBT9676433.1 hypothetical protein [Levilactobacillus brevis]MCZ2120174.1 hypothetical protein [Levilactobacillus brevis]MCZ2125662.1 hypothetical protein [Levilactobacillus brevis]MCZ2210010.1 hypothetical protein [Levilactobacillus brevis]MCZ2325454.1 hypothetical protein [Levilactobacillus brevis]